MKTDSLSQERKKNLRLFLRRMTARKIVLFGLIGTLFFVILALFAPLIATADPNEMAMLDKLADPSSAHWFGTDMYGRDIFSRVVYGAQVSLIIGVTSVLLASIVGCFLGMLAAYNGGIIDTLLMRFCDVDAGSITLNGHNVRDFDRSALREGFGMVLQDTWLFKGTIMENIRYGRLDATDEEVIAAAKAANADHFIRTLPGGYQMELNEDASNVSQGQKQLLTIARTILADNRILILDEATSSVDTRTEQRIQTAMDRLMEGRTSFVIAHRLSTIRDADLILVMRDGDIVEQGTHDQLIEAGGFYADLYNSQFEDVVD